MSRKQFGKWQLQSHGALLRWQAMELKFDPWTPDLGAELSFDAPHPSQRLFGIPQIKVLPDEKLDPYARGCDLIVSYVSSETRPIGAELYWRWAEFPEPTDESNDAEDSNELGTMELIYSLQTPLLDTQPNPRVVSQMFGEAVSFFSLDSDGQLSISATDSPESAVACLVQQANEMVLLIAMPSDLKRMTVTTSEADAKTATKTASDSSRFQIECELNSEFLEKGVIRRLRLWAGFGTGQCEAQLLDAARHFLNSEIPLTA